MKIAIIGPVTPFVSGISQHTSALAKELSGRSDITLKSWSFSRQYPAALFPGDTQKGDAEPLAHTQFTLDTLNPLSWCKTARDIERFNPDLAILPAWTFFVVPALGAVAGALRKRGIEVVSVVHNAQDHEASGWKNALLAWQIKQSSRAITHNAPLAEKVKEIAPQMGVTVSPHPLYDSFPPATGALPRRAATELLYFGVVRPYKGLDILIDALGQMTSKDVHLTIAGEFWGGAEATLEQIARLGLSDRIELRPGFASDQDVAELFERCDYLVTPYRSATGSGVIAVAQHYERPVIASDISGLREAVSDGQTGWLVAPDDRASLAQILDDKANSAAVQQMAPALISQKERLSWSHFADVLLAP